MAFDISGARQEGYDDSKIADHLASLHQYDIAGARAEGYTDTQIANHLAEKSTTLAAVKNFVSPPSISDIAEKVTPSTGGEMSTVSDRAMNIATQRVMSPKSDQPEDLMAKASKFVAGSTSPRIADQAAVHKTPEQIQADGIASAGRYTDKIQQEQDAVRAKENALRQQTAESLPNSSAALSGLARLGSNIADIPQFANDSVKHFVVNPILHLAGQEGMSPTKRFEIAKDLENAANDFSPKVKNLEDLDFSNPSEVAKWASVNALQQAPQMAMGAAASFIPKLRAGYLGLMGAMSGAGQYQQNLEKGVDEDRAMMDGITNGLFEIIGESIGFGVFDKLGKPLAAMTSMQRASVAKEMTARLLIGTTKMAGQMGAEGIGEGITQFGQNASQKYVAKDQSIQLKDGVINAVGIGALMGAPTAAAHGYRAATQPITAGQQLGAALQDGVDNAQADSRSADAAALDALNPGQKQYTPLTERLAGISARQKSQATGVEHEVIPHPTQADKFIAVPKRQAEQVSAAPVQDGTQASQDAAMPASDILGMPSEQDILDEGIAPPMTPKERILADMDKTLQAGKERAAAILMPRVSQPDSVARPPSQNILAAPKGKDHEIHLPSGGSLPAQWDVVDADSVTASLKEGIAQPRDRTRAASDAQVRGIANNPRYELTSDSPMMDLGAPTISKEGHIVGGNGRFEGISRAYEQGTAGEYLAKLKADAQAKGIDPAVIDTMKKPVLVRRVMQDFDPRALAIQSNSGSSLQYSRLELAKIDADRMGDLSDIQIADNGDVAMTGANVAAIKRATHGYSATELGSFTDAEGGMSQEGALRVRNAVLYQAYGNSAALTRLVESNDNDLRTISGALLRSASTVAAARSDMKDGKVPAELDILPELSAAIEALAKIKADGSSVQQFMAQQGMFEDGLSKESQDLLQYLDENIRSQKRIAELIKAYYADVASIDLSTADIFGERTLPTKQEILGHAKQTIGGNTETTDLFQSNRRSSAESGEKPSTQSAPAQRTGEGQQEEVGKFGEKGVDANATMNTDSTKGKDDTARLSVNPSENIPEQSGESKPRITLMYSGKPFATERLAQASINQRKLDAVPVAVEGGFGIKHLTDEEVARAKADADMRDALSDLGAIMRDVARVQRIIPEKTPALMRTLVKLFDAAFRKGYYDLKDAARYVRKLLSENEATKAGAQFIPESMMKEAAAKAAAAMPEGFFDSQGLFGQTAQQEVKVEHVQDRMTNADKKRNPDNFKVPPLHTFVDAKILQDTHDAIAKSKHLLAKKEVELDHDEVEFAKLAIAPVLAKAEKNFSAFKELVIDIAHESGIGQMVAGIKKMDRCVEKMLNPADADDYTARDMFGRLEEVRANEFLRDTLRATIVIQSYNDIEATLKSIKDRFNIERVKDRVSKPNETGYRDILVNVILADGLKAEIQINTPAMLAAKDLGHEAYAIQRSVKEGSIAEAELIAAQKSLYSAAFAAASDLQSSSVVGKKNSGLSTFQQTSPLTLKNIPSGNLNMGNPSKFSPNSVPTGNSAGTGNLSGNSLISNSSKHTIAKNASTVHTNDLFSGENTTEVNDENGTIDIGGAQGKVSKATRRVAASGKSGSVHLGFGGRTVVRNKLPLVTDSQTEGAGRSGDVAPEGGNTQQRETGGKRDRAERTAGVPAGRDIPAKSGLNYHFTGDDLDYKGSWIAKAKQNIAAIELVQKLESEKRNATRAEQAVLARFIGWGAGEIRNKIFDPQIDRVRRKVDVLKSAQEWLANNKKDALTRFDYGSPYHTVKSMLDASGNPVPWGDSITKPMLDKLADKEAVVWLELHDQLKGMLSSEEWKTAERSTQYAHYTGKAVVNEMYRALDRMGFKGGAILEPGAGNGVFPGLMPESMAVNSIYTGIEYDALTGAILKHLQPDERILVESFIDSSLPDNFYDVAIGNPPFSDSKVLSDPRYKKNNFALHDYFFAKTMDKVKPGGLVMFVTSRHTMDKQGDKARQYLAERADLLGAIRLPETAFKKNAGTEVVTDILFLRKKESGKTFVGHDWMKLDSIKVKGGTHLINEYFAAHPEMVLGSGAMESSQHGLQYTVLPNKEVPIETLLANAIDTLPRDIVKADQGSAAEAAQVREIDWNPKAKKEGNYYVSDDGKLMQIESRAGVPAKVAAKDLPMLKSFVALRDAVNQSQYDQLNGGDWEASLKALQKQYKAFVKEHGNILQHTVTERVVKIEDEETGAIVEDTLQTRRFTLINKLNDDPEYTKVMALEVLDDDTGKISPSKFLTERLLEKPKAAEISTPHDALLTSLNNLGHVDMSTVAKLIGMSEREVVEALGTAVYESPSEGWVMADDYLSGNVKAKLKQAQEAAKSDKRYERNVQALTQAQPSPVPPSDITASIGMNWIPSEVYEQFLKEKAEVEAKITYNEHTGNWSVNAIRGYGSVKATSEWGTPQRPANEIIEAALTGRPIRITKTEGSGKDKKSVFDANATEAANQKLKEMREAFKTWIWQDTARTDKLVALYNDKFNTTVSRKFDGRHLTLPGSTSTISVFDHVKRGAWRIIQSGNTYLAHAVGSGKTWQMVISAMEQKRLGLINKPMMVVPNHMLQQFAQEWMQLYPAARLMVADEKQFHTENRKRFVARAAMSDLDGVIITHSAFKLLDLDPEFRQKMIQEQLDYMEAALTEIKTEEGIDDAAKSRNPKVRDIQNRIEKMEEKLKAAMSGEGKDKAVRFDEMGVDFMYVDEAHEYRKLPFTTARQVKGIDSSGSERSFDLYMKSRWLEEKHPGRSLVMASGTPVTNTLAEIYTVQRFMQPDVLEERGLQEFDAWASMFGEEHTEIEADASGKYAPVTRFSKFINVPELTQMFREFADVLTSDHLAEMLGDKRPKLKNGSRKIVVTPETSDYKVYRQELARRLEVSRKWKPSRDEPNNPDPIIKIIGDGRLAAIDMRFVDPSLPSDPDSKLNQMIDGVVASYKKYKNFEYINKEGVIDSIKGATQMVFSDIGFGAGVSANRGFDARAWMIRRLQAAGIPMPQIAFMSDYKKSAEKVKLFKDVNAGRVRILIGSSKNMGTGVNAQQRLRSLHHLDTPWYPADLEQREGRIVRQGNKNKHVRVYAYSTKGSYDTVMWQLLARKQKFIDQALSGDSSVRELDDISESSQFAMATAMTAGDERAIQLAGLRADIEKYQRLFRAHEENRMRIKESYQLAGNTITSSERRLPEAEKLADKIMDLSGDKFTAMAGKQVFTERKEFGDVLLAKLKKHTDSTKEGKEEVGELSGFPINVIGVIDKNSDGKPIGYYARLEMRIGEDAVILARDPIESPVGMVMRATNALVGISRKPEELRLAISDAKSKRNALEGRMDAPFQFTEELTNRKNEADAIEAAMLADSNRPDGVVLEEKAKAFAEKYHGEIDQRRKYTNEPYITHPAGVVEILKTVQHTPEMVAAAWAHDTVEDTKATLEDVRRELGDEVASLVAELTSPTSDGNTTRAERAQAKREYSSKASPAAQTIKLADIIHNSEASATADPEFAKTYLAEKALQVEGLTKGDAKLLERARNLLSADGVAVRQNEAQYKLFAQEGENELPKNQGSDRDGSQTAKARVIRAAKAVQLQETPNAEGIYYVTAKLEKVGERSLPGKITSTQEAANATAYLSRFAVEHFDAIVTDISGKPLAIIGSFKGASTEASVYPATLVQELAKIKGAANVWASHNHPSGTAVLSDADRRISGVIEDLLRDSGIVYRGLMAVAGGKFESTTYDNGEINKATTQAVKTPVVERVIEGDPLDSMAIHAPNDAKRVVPELAKDKTGILFLSAQHAPVSFVPFAAEEMNPLRQNGRLMKLINAAASTGASASMIANPNGAIQPDQFNNLAAALREVGARVLDVITYSADGVSIKSEAESGRLNPSSTIFSIADSAPITKSQWLSAAQLAQVAEERLAQFKHQPKILIRDSVADVLGGAAGNDGVVSGMVHKGNIYLFRDGISDTAAATRTLWHELLHYGLRRFMTKEQYIPAMQKLYDRDAWIKQQADAWLKTSEADEAKKSGMAYARARGVDEALASLAETNEGNYQNDGVLAKTIRAVTNWVADIAERFGFKEAAARWRGVASSEAHTLVQTTFRKLRNDEPATSSDWAFTSDPSFKVSKQNHFVLPEETALRAAQRNIQDYQVRWDVVQDAVKEQGGILNETNDVFLALKLYSGRVAAAFDAFQRKTLEPILERAAKNKISLDEVAEYLYAQHAQERNAQIASINANMPDGGSGMTDAEAKHILSDFAQRKDFKELKSIADDLRKITDSTLQLLVKFGVFSQAHVDAYQNTYKNYVPLKGFEQIDETGKPSGTGQGHSTAAKLDKRALGRKSRAGQIIENIVRDHEAAILACEKANIGRRVRKFVSENPDSNLWTVQQAPVTQALVGSMVSLRKNVFDPEKEIRFIEGDNEVRIQLHDPLLLRAYNRLGFDGMGKLFELSGQFNGFLRQMYTQKNPAFFLINPIRDLQDMGISLTGYAGSKVSAKAFKHWPGAWLAMTRYSEQEKSTSTFLGRHTVGSDAKAWQPWIDQFKANGGAVGFAWVGDIQQKQERIDHLMERLGGEGVYDAIRQGKIKQGAKRMLFRTLNNELFDVIEHLNYGFENASRLATFRAAVESGVSPREAGRMAKQVTTNFNDKGEVGGEFNALYLFGNAAIQGTANIARVMISKQSKHKGQVYAIIGTIIGMGVLAGLGDDDEDKDLIPDYEKRRNWSVDLGGNTRITLPKPYGWSFFHDLGRAIAHATKHAGDDGVMQRESIAIAASFLENLSPLNPIPNHELNSSDMTQSIMPTIIKPFVQSAMNRSSFGAPIMPESTYKPNQPDSMKEWRKTRGTLYESLAQGINSATGGNAVEPGAVDVSPETLKQIASFLTGGAGRFATDSMSSAFELSTQGETKLETAPVIKSFYKHDDVDSYLRRFYDQSGEVAKLNEIGRAYAKLQSDDGDAGVDKVRSNPLSSLNADSVRQQVAKLRDEQDEIRADKTLTPKEKRMKVDASEADERDLLKEFDVRYKEAKSEGLSSVRSR